MYIYPVSRLPLSPFSRLGKSHGHVYARSEQTADIRGIRGDQGLDLDFGQPHTSSDGYLVHRSHALRAFSYPYALELELVLRRAQAPAKRRLALCEVRTASSLDPVRHICTAGPHRPLVKHQDPPSGGVYTQIRAHHPSDRALSSSRHRASRSPTYLKAESPARELPRSSRCSVA